MSAVPVVTGSLARVAGLLAEGVTVAGAAARLGLPRDLVATMVDELERLGLASTARSGLPTVGCASCATHATCGGCPLAPRG